MSHMLHSEVRGISSTALSEGLEISTGNLGWTMQVTLHRIIHVKLPDIREDVSIGSLVQFLFR